jgi:mycofactocin precursor
MTVTETAPEGSLVTDELAVAVPEPVVDGELIEEELLVEEISIDGMCGVY